MSSLKISLVSIVLFVLPLSVFGQKETTIIGRMGMRNAATYHFFEAFETHRGRWIYPDIGYIDFAQNGYWEIFFGGGAILYNNSRFTVIHCSYIERAEGRLSNSATYYVPWTYVGYRFNKKFIGETVYFPYLPLNKPARIQHVFERTKIEHELKRFKYGGGYGAYQYGEGNWQHKPFATLTLKTGPIGELEFWLQRLPGNHIQAQIRLAKTFKEK